MQIFRPGVYRSKANGMALEFAQASSGALAECVHSASNLIFVRTNSTEISADLLLSVFFSVTGWSEPPGN